MPVHIEEMTSEITIVEGELPMTPAQILWVNMVTSVALGLVFAFDPAEPGVMRRPPRDPRSRPRAAIIASRRW